ncbi:hypothetical protein TNCV_1652451 [Trichonephila clavipes]|nr:hypothetical protein TNCV_1652451 [Trichonephila clavipes]
MMVWWSPPKEPFSVKELMTSQRSRDIKRRNPDASETLLHASKLYDAPTNSNGLSLYDCLPDPLTPMTYHGSR